MATGLTQGNTSVPTSTPLPVGAGKAMGGGGGGGWGGSPAITTPLGATSLNMSAPIVAAPTVSPIKPLPNKTVTPTATVTSNPAQERATAHTENVTQINNQQANSQATAQQKAATGYNPNVSVVDFLASKGQPSDYASRAAKAKELGISNYTGTADQNTRMLQMLANAPAKKETTPAEKAVTDLTATGTKANTGTGTPITKTDVNGNTITTNPDGTTTTTTKTGSKITTDVNGNKLSEYKSKTDKIYDNIETAHQEFLTRMADATAGKLNANEQAQVDLITQQFEKLRQQQITANKNYEGGITQLGIVSGRQRYAPEVQLGTQQAAINTGIAKLSDITMKEQQTVTAYKQAVQDKNYKLAETLWKEANDYNSEKVSHLNDIYDKTVKFEKEVRDQNETMEKNVFDRVTKPIQEIQMDIAKNGAPTEVLNEVANAKTPEEAIVAAGDYLQSATGMVGEYQYYKRQEEEAGRTPMNFNAYQTLDANRKQAIARASAPKTTVAEKTANAYSMINQLMTMKSPSGMPYMDTDTYFTAQGFKDIVQNAIEDGITKQEILKQYGSFLSPWGIENNTYGLTEKDKKDIGVTE